MDGGQSSGWDGGLGGQAAVDGEGEGGMGPGSQSVVPCSMVSSTASFSGLGSSIAFWFDALCLDRNIRTLLRFGG